MGRHGARLRRRRHSHSQAGVGSIRRRGAAWAGLGAGRALHARPVARDRRLLPPAPRALRRHRHRRRARRAGDRGRGQLPGRAAEQAVGPDRQPAEQPVRADRQGAAEPGGAGQVHRLRQADRVRPVPHRASRRTPTTPRRSSVEYIDPDTKPVEAQESGIQQYGTVVVELHGQDANA